MVKRKHCNRHILSASEQAVKRTLLPLAGSRDTTAIPTKRNTTPQELKPKQYVPMKRMRDYFDDENKKKRKEKCQTRQTSKKWNSNKYLIVQNNNRFTRWNRCGNSGNLGNSKFIVILLSFPMTYNKCSVYQKPWRIM